MAKIEKNNPIIESRLKKLRKIVAQLESVPKEKRDGASNDAKRGQRRRG